MTKKASSDSLSRAAPDDLRQTFPREMGTCGTESIEGEPSERPRGSVSSEGNVPGEPDLARYLRDWTAMWWRETQAQMADALDHGTVTGSSAGLRHGLQDGVEPMLEAWRAAVTLWAEAMLVAPSSLVAPRDRGQAASPRPGEIRPGEIRPGEARAGETKTGGAGPGEAGEAGAAAAAVASDAVDDALRRLTRRVDDLEARLAGVASPRLEAPAGTQRRRRG